MGVVRFFRSTPCAALLAVQMLGVLLYPFFEDSVAGRSLFPSTTSPNRAIQVLTQGESPGLTWVAVTLVVTRLVGLNSSRKVT